MTVAPVTPPTAATAPGWSEQPELTGHGLRLTPLRLADAGPFFTALGTPEERAEVTAHLTYPPLPDLAAVRRALALALSDRTRLAYGQWIGSGDGSGAEFIGTTSFYEINEGLRSLAIGHTWFARSQWRTGANTRSKLLMLDRAFVGLGAERVVWHTDIRNVRSQEAIARLGAQREGVLRHHRIRPDGSWRDTVQFAMLSEEWPEARDRLAARLARG